MMQKKKNGFALVTTLVIVFVLAGMLAIMSTGAVGDLRQRRSSSQVSQARAIAEAADVNANSYVLGANTKAILKTLLDPYVATFVGTGATASGNPATAWIVPNASWAKLGTDLQTELNKFSNDYVSTIPGSTATTAYTITQMRGVSRAFQVQTMIADYKLVSVGKLNDGSQRTIETTGTLTFQLGRPSLSQYVFLVDDAAGGSTGYFDGTSSFNGPAHANKNWGFNGNPGPNFGDTVTTSSNSVYFWKNGSNPIAMTAQTGNGTVPKYTKPLVFNAPKQDLPVNAISQSLAALGLDPFRDISPNDGIPDAATALEMCQQLTPAAICTAASTVPSGVYVPNKAGSVAGGIYLKGDVDKVAMSTPSAGIQRYTITQTVITATVPTVTTYVIDVNYNTNQTIVQKTAVRLGVTTPSLPLTYSGVLSGQAIAAGTNGQIYGDGAIKSLSGPARTGTVPASKAGTHPPPNSIPPALALETQLNIAAKNQIDLTGDITYECDPVSPQATTRCTNAKNAGTINTVLGVISETSNVNIGLAMPNEPYLCGSYLIGTNAAGNSTLGLTVQGVSAGTTGSRPNQGTMHLFGGLIQPMDQLRSNGSSGYAENYDYDKRFANSGLAPPNFPTSKVFTPQAPIFTPISFKEY